MRPGETHATGAPGAGAVVLLAATLLACRPPVPAPIHDRSPGAESRPADPAAPTERPLSYVVSEGDTLYAIAWRFGLDFRTLAAWNDIGPPYLIRPGLRLRLSAPPSVPAAVAATGVTTQPASPPPKPVAPVAAPVDEPPSARSTPPPRPATPAPAPAPAPTAPVAAAGPIRWQWPTDGPIISGFVAGSQRGLDIGGELGQPIHAAAAGEVVYSGVGLVGYGELIIIKHDERYLSAYAHNRRRLVGEGERVDRGRQIAEMGDTGTDRPKLHFEIREDGQPVDPRRYLPARAAGGG